MLSFEYWVHKIFVNCAIKKYNENKKYEDFVSKLPRLGNFEEYYLTSPNQDSIIDTRQIIEDLKAQLPRKYYEFLYMCVSGKTEREIIAAMGIEKREELYVLRHRAVESVKKSFANRKI